MGRRQTVRRAPRTEAEEAAAALDDLGLVDPTTGRPDARLDAQLRPLVEVAVRATGMSRGAVNLLDVTHLHAIGAFGFRTCSVPREQTLCAQITGRAPDVYAFADLEQEPGFWGNPAVDGRVASVRVYASAPIQSRGTVIGTLCVVHDEPHPLTLQQCDRLRETALRAEELLQRWHDHASRQQGS